MIRVFIIEKAPFTCVVIAAALSNRPGVELTGFAPAAERSTLNQIKKSDVVLVNTTFSPDQALANIQFLRREMPGLKILAIGLPESEQVIEQYLQAGASGCVLEKEPMTTLPEIIQTLHSQEGNSRNGETLPSR